jgi:hypothetical protein
LKAWWIVGAGIGGALLVCFGGLIYIGLVVAPSIPEPASTALAETSRPAPVVSTHSSLPLPLPSITSAAPNQQSSAAAQPTSTAPTHAQPVLIVPTPADFVVSVKGKVMTLRLRKGVRVDPSHAYQISIAFDRSGFESWYVLSESMISWHGKVDDAVPLYEFREDLDEGDDPKITEVVRLY